MSSIKAKRKKTIKSKKIEEIKAGKKETANLGLPVYDMEGKEVSTVKLAPEIFNVKMNPNLVYQVATSQMANRRKVIAHAKDRSEVKGGGKKPWRQKGTGRARHGSIRSPLWKGGGVTFGPTKARVFKKEIPKKMRRLAFFMVISAKAQNSLLILLDKLKIEKSTQDPQGPTGQAPAAELRPLRGRQNTKLTKSMAEILKKLPCRNESCLIALPEMDKNLILATRNLPDVQTVQAKDLNCLDLLSFKYLLMPKESVKIIKDIFLK